MRLATPQLAHALRHPWWTCCALLWVVLLAPTSASALEVMQPTCTGSFAHPMETTATSHAVGVFERMVSSGYGQLTPMQPESASQAASKTEDVTPCGASSGIDPTNPEYNFCFEGTREPVSTLPDLLARYQAEEAANAIFGVVAQLGTQSTGHIPRTERAPSTLPERPWLAALVASIERSAPQQQNSPLTCSDHTELCRSLPPALPGLALAGLVPLLPPVEIAAKSYPQLQEPPAQPALERLRVGPGIEYRRLLEQPPQHRSAAPAA